MEKQHLCGLSHKAYQTPPVLAEVTFIRFPSVSQSFIDKSYQDRVKGLPHGFFGIQVSQFLNLPQIEDPGLCLGLLSIAPSWPAPWSLLSVSTLLFHFPGDPSFQRRTLISAAVP